MSMNLHLDSYDNDVSLQFPQFWRVGLIQTPTEVSYRLMVEGDPEGTRANYIKWVQSNWTTAETAEHIATIQALENPTFSVW